MAGNLKEFIDAGDVKPGMILGIGDSHKAEKVTKVTGKNPRETWDGEKGDWVMKPTKVEIRTASTKQVFSTSNPVPIMNNEMALDTEGHWFYR